MVGNYLDNTWYIWIRGSRLRGCRNGNNNVSTRCINRIKESRGIVEKYFLQSAQISSFYYNQGSGNSLFKSAIPFSSVHSSYLGDNWSSRSAGIIFFTGTDYQSCYQNKKC